MLDPIHPFPARMAPEIAFEFLGELPRDSVVLDPMCGSGVSLRSAVEKGHRSIGFDADPLAVLMSKVWTEGNHHTKLESYGEDLVRSAGRRSRAVLPWHNNDDETQAFIKFWFAAEQRRDLTRLAAALDAQEDQLPDYIARALKIALSRLIITKTRGASLAWDVAHSRPHRKKISNDFDVLAEFVRSCKVLSKKLRNNKPEWSCSVRRGDVRELRLPDQSVDAIITSPPYLNAIDYMRGHRLSLVWLGYALGDLKVVRSEAVGSESNANRSRIRRALKKELRARTQQLIDRYINDLGHMLREFKRVTRPKGKVCVITANSNIRGYEVRTNTLVQAAAAGAGLTLADEKVRRIETARRYLPTTSRNEALRTRMMEEHIQYFVA